jgi:hypothetical protein
MQDICIFISFVYSRFVSAIYQHEDQRNMQALKRKHLKSTECPALNGKN